MRTEKSAHDVNTTTKTSKEAPRPELGIALQQFIPWVLEIFDLPTKYKEEMVVVSVSLGEGKNGGLVVSAHKKLSGANGPGLLHTPHVPFAADKDDAPRIPESVMEFVRNIEREAEKFWNGERAQLGLDMQGSQPYKQDSDEDNSKREVVRGIDTAPSKALPKGEKGAESE